MPTLDDERFESQLKQFRPLVPDPLPARKPGRRVLVWAAGLAATAIVAGTLAFHFHAESARVAETNRPGESASRVNGPASIEALTMRSANELMAKAPSFKAFVDDMAACPQPAPLPKDKRSAIAVLSTEKIKL